jgi:ABC-type multidrug transport system fused ATPase/permease subunit
MTGTIQEAVSGIETLKAFCMGDIISNAFAKKVWTLAKKIVRRNIRFDFAQSLWQIVLIPYQAVFFGVGGYWYITRGVPSIGTLFAFLNYIGILIPATMTLINILMQISEDFASFDRVTEYLEQEPEKSGTKVIPESPSLEVVFQNVSFSYDNVNLIVNDISFTAESGKCVALVGQTGSGKTTLVRLLLKFYDCQKGNITISNIDIKDISLQSLRSRIGIVTQETFLFNRSIKENLLYANPLATMENIIDCCKKAQIHEFILSLALGYDTIIGERGVNLSGGEKQRLSIARVLLKNPDIVIMDESTSSLDVITEALLLKATNEYFKDKTMIIIAHRLSTIRKADKIIVLENGHISEIGEYDELVNKNGLFSKLHYQQFNDKNNIVSSQTAIVS